MSYVGKVTDGLMKRKTPFQFLNRFFDTSETQGSCFLLNDAKHQSNILVTNRHVVENLTPQESHPKLGGKLYRVMDEEGNFALASLSIKANVKNVDQVKKENQF